MVRRTENISEKTSKMFTVTSDNRKQFGERLKILIKENGISQEKFAESIAVSLPTVKKWCAGLYVPDVDELQKIYERYNASLDWLVLGIQSSDEFLNPYLPIDSFTLEEVIAAVEMANNIYKLVLTTTQKAKIYTILYDEKTSDKKTNVAKRATQLLSLLSIKE